MMPNRATHSRAGQAMTTRHVSDHAPDDGAFGTAMGACNDRQRSGKNRESKRQR
jgi:hypothetical protein